MPVLSQRALEAKGPELSLGWGGASPRKPLLITIPSLLHLLGPTLAKLANNPSVTYDPCSGSLILTTWMVSPGAKEQGTGPGTQPAPDSGSGFIISTKTITHTTCWALC